MAGNVDTPEAVLKILFLCWRDIRHPRAGGAEVFIHEVGRRLVRDGHGVTLFSAGFKGLSPDECLDGVRILRSGAQATVHWRFFRWWRRHGRFDEYDLVIDVVNTIPFMTPLFIKGRTKRVALFFQLARQVWWYESRFPLSACGYASEPLYLQAYRGTQVVTISRSSKADLERYRVPADLISICPVGIDIEPLEALEPKPAGLDVLFVGRLTASKRPEEALRAFAAVRASRPEARLRIVGNGRERYVKRVIAVARELGLGGEVEFLGRVSHEEKIELMRSSHVIVVTSVKEGWGLIVTEAAALGTPAIVYDVDGLRDSVRDGTTGVVCKDNTPRALASEVLSLVVDPERYERLRSNALAWSREFTWDHAAAEFKRIALIP